MSGQVYKLLHPVELKNTQGEVVERIEQLTLSRLNGKAMREIGNAKARGEGEMMGVMVCKSSNLPPSTVDQLDAEDFTAAGIIVAGFIGGVQAIGAM